MPEIDVTFREVGPGDEAVIEHLLGGLDPGSRYSRWFTGGVDLRAAEDWAAHPERHAAVGVLAFAGPELVGHGALVPAPGGRGEVAFEVAAGWRHRGIAGGLLRRLIQSAQSRGLRELYADVLSENADMLAVMRESGPHVESRDGGVTTVTIPVAT